MSKFIRTHAAYLEEKIAAFRELKVDYVRDAGRVPVPFSQMSTDELVNTAKVLQVQMDHLLDNEVWRVGKRRNFCDYLRVFLIVPD